MAATDVFAEMCRPDNTLLYRLIHLLSEDIRAIHHLFGWPGLHSLYRYHAQEGAIVTLGHEKPKVGGPIKLKTPARFFELPDHWENLPGRKRRFWAYGLMKPSSDSDPEQLGSWAVAEMIWEPRDEDDAYGLVTSVETRRIWDPKLLWAETGNGVRPLAVIRDLHNLVIKSTNHIEDDLRRARELSATATASVRLLNGVIRSCGSKPLSRQEQGAFLFLTTIDPELARYTPFGIPEDILQCIKRLTEGNSAEKILP